MSSVAIVTSANRGIVEAIVLGLAESGLNIAGLGAKIICERDSK